MFSGFASGMTAAFMSAGGLFSIIFNLLLNAVSWLLCWGVKKGMETAGDKNRDYERIAWDGGSVVNTEKVKEYTKFQQFCLSLLGLAIILGFCFGLYCLHMLFEKLLGKYWVFGWFGAAIALIICKIASTAITKSMEMKTPPEFSPCFAFKKSVIGFDFDHSLVYMGDSRFSPKIFKFEDIAAYGLLGRSMPEENTDDTRAAIIRVNLESIYDPVRIINFGSVDSAMQAARNLHEMFQGR